MSWNQSDPMEEKKPEILIDHRESKSRIAEILKGMGAEVKLAVLPVGDFILSPRTCVERKRREDFEASIIDGRLFSQAKELSTQFEKPILVIEGERFEERVSRPALLGAISSLMLDFNLSIFFTKNAEKTAEFLFAVAKREQLSEKKPLRLLGEKHAYSPAQQKRMIVEALPGVGPKIARNLITKFKTVEKLMKAKEAQLEKVDGIGPEKAKAIRKLLTEDYEEKEDPETAL